MLQNGELYRLIQGDCLEVMRGFPDGCVDMVFTSPPYNLGNSSGGGFPGGRYPADARPGKRGGCGKWSGGSLANGYGTHSDDMPHEEYVAWQKECLTEMWRLLSPAGAIFYNHKPRIFNGQLVTPFEYNPDLPVRQVVIWARAGGINFSPTFYVPTHEWVVIFAKDGFRLRDKRASGVGDVWYVPQESNPDHPAPFPLRLPLTAMETVSEDVRVVLDPFAGSGTTIRAALLSGRKAIGIELDPTYHAIAQRRIAAVADVPPLFAQAQPGLFDGEAV